MRVPFQGPWHRRNLDPRPDDVVNADIFRELARRYTVQAAIDDRTAPTYWRCGNG